MSGDAALSDAARQNLVVGDIVQITNEEHHWFPALIIVSEVKGFGCQGYMISIVSNDPEVANNPAYIRLARADYELVGHAMISVPDESEA